MKLTKPAMVRMARSSQLISVFDGPTKGKMTILQDAASRPRLFEWVGAPEPVVLDRWLTNHGLQMPDDLLAFWRATGGGVAFESEELLPPIGAVDPADNLWPRNEWHRSQGMPADFLVFHEGVCLSAVRTLEPRYVTLRAVGYTVDEEHPSFSEWYQRALRDEFADRYGLSPEERPGRRTRG